MFAVLTAARARIAEEKHWCQNILWGSTLNIKTGERIDMECARGAILSVLDVDRSKSEFPQDKEYSAELVKDIPPGYAIHGLKDPRFILAMYNNTHSHKEVIALFDKTIARLKRQQQVIDNLTTANTEAV